MIKHLYFHSSNLDYTKYIREIESFEPAYLYNKKELGKSSPNEWGRLRVGSTYLHFLVGKILRVEVEQTCHWCSGNLQLIKVKDGSQFMPTTHSEFCMQCTQCESRGPMFCAQPELECDEEVMEWLASFMSSRYSQIKMWDHDLKTDEKDD